VRITIPNIKPGCIAHQLVLERHIRAKVAVPAYHDSASRRYSMTFNAARGLRSRRKHCRKRMWEKATAFTAELLLPNLYVVGFMAGSKQRKGKREKKLLTQIYLSCTVPFYVS